VPNTWIVACAEELTTGDGALDAPTCHGHLALGRFLLDEMATRVDEEARSFTPALPTRNNEIGVTTHGAHVAADVGWKPTVQPLGWWQLEGWRILRAKLHGYLVAMERVYATHAIYSALDMARFEYALVRQLLPDELCDDDEDSLNDTNGGCGTSAL
jgi:hypothetical protein